MAKAIYICEYCHTGFNTRTEARMCEISHEFTSDTIRNNDKSLGVIMAEGKDPCDFCERAYYVYGSERNCDCVKNCKNYDLFWNKYIQFKI